MLARRNQLKAKWLSQVQRLEGLQTNLTLIKIGQATVDAPDEVKTTQDIFPYK
jgi:hypothetical protein